MPYRSFAVAACLQAPQKSGLFRTENPSTNGESRAMMIYITPNPVPFEAVFWYAVLPTCEGECRRCMLFDGWLALMLLGATALFAGLCMAVVRAFFSKSPSRAAYRAVALWAVSFAAAVVGCPLASDSFGTAGAAGFVVVLCFATSVLYLLLSRWWEGRDAAAAVAYLQMCRMRAPDAHRAPGGAAADAGDGGAGKAAGDARAAGESDDLVSERDPAIVCAMAARDFDLTRREEEILLLLLDGRSFASIAGELFISDNTVKTHVRHIYRKTGVNRKEDLVRRVYG